jgi:nascent polypeptide-associated complex subunit alpha
MIPGVDPRQMKQMMRQMGISQEEISATEVIIKTNEFEYVFKNPSVQKVKMQGQETFQIAGDFEKTELKIEVEINDDDVKMVLEGANVSEEKAKEELKKTNGDIAQAITNLIN